MMSRVMGSALINSTSEIRNKHEARKSKKRKRSQSLSLIPFRYSSLLHSDLFRISRFGIRIFFSSSCVLRCGDKSAPSLLATDYRPFSQARKGKIAHNRALKPQTDWGSIRLKPTHGS